MESPMTTTFRQLHGGPDVLLLANCWDGITARMIASLGAKAMATTSAAVAWANGYPDGDALPLELHVQTIRAIRRVIGELPLSVDAEGGYSDDPAAVATTIGALVEAGAVGINIEDGGSPPELLAAKISRIKRAHPDLFINARCDVYLRGLVPAADRVRETLERAARYADAGADGIFVPGPTDPETIRALTAGISRPVNLLARPGLPGAKQLAELGVRRLSAGSGLAQWSWGHVGALARAFLSDGRSDPLADGAVAYGTINPLFSAR
jgi:2-methylisocitrate lyase-like PEP mutase family enzyme